jgi:hypothetical protein
MVMKRQANQFVWVFFCGLASLLYAGAYSGGSGTAADPYQIATKADLLELAATTADYSSYFIMTANIDLTGETFNAAVIAPDTVASLSFNGTKFTGNFDGNGHIISNLMINKINNYFIGLFGYVDSAAQISNLGLEGVDITGYYYVGGLCGYNKGTISRCYAAGEVTGNNIYVGGLCGYNSSGTFSQCYTTCTVTGGAETGGLCGYNSSGTLSQCYATGTVTGTTNVGGLCGRNYSGPISQCYAAGAVTGSGNYVAGLCGYNNVGTISQCYATGTVTGSIDYIGGLYGYNFSGTVSQCYATGAVSGNSSASRYVGGLGGTNYGTVNQCYAAGTVSGYSYVGGLCGRNNSGTPISQCYAAGAVTGISYVGGLCGQNYSATGSSAIVNYCYAAGAVTGTSDVGGLCGQNSGTFNYCFWNTTTSGLFVSAGGTGLTTTEMKTLSIFTDAGWDFLDETVNGTNDYWRMCVNDVHYPKLTWRHIEVGDFACPDGVAMDDFNRLSRDWMMTYSATLYGADANGDGIVDMNDLAVLVQRWLEL